MTVVQKLRHILTLLLLLLTAAGAMAIDGQRLQIRHYGFADGLHEQYISHGIQDSMGYLWFASDNGLLRYDSNKFRIYKSHVGDGSSMNTNKIEYVAELDNHDIICHTNEGNFLFKRKSETFEPSDIDIEAEIHQEPGYASMTKQIQRSPEYSGTNAKVRLIDNQGGIWINCTRGLERACYSHNPLVPFNVGCEQDIIRAILVNSNGSYWMAGSSGMVRLMSPDHKPIGYLAPNGQLVSTPVVFGAYIYIMYKDRQGRLWFGSKPDGLFLLTSAGEMRFKVRHFIQEPDNKYSINCNYVYGITEDKQGRLWLATFGGGANLIREKNDGTILFINKTNEFKHYPKEQTSLRCVTCTNDGAVVFGGNDGIMVTDPRKAPQNMHFDVYKRNINDSTSLGSSLVMSLYETTGKNGQLYVGTNGDGIFQVTNKHILGEKLKFHSLTNTFIGMPNDVCFALLGNSKGNILSISREAVVRYDLSTKVMDIFHNSVFAEGFQFSEAMPARQPDGTLLLGTTNGIIALNPQRIEKSNFVPEILFEHQGDITLPSNTKNVRIEFSALDYNAKTPIVYAYYLEGFNNEWRYTSEGNVRYENFPAGTYILHVKSTNGDGVWVDNEATITITRKAALTETHWLWMIIGGIILLLAIIIYQIIHYIMRLHSEVKEVKEQSDEQIGQMTQRVNELMEHHTDVPVEQAEERDPDELFRKKIKEYVAEHISDPTLRVEDLASHTGVGMTICYRKCKQLLGYTPSAYIHAARMKQAQKLLAQPSTTIDISTIAYRCGFTDPKYFGRCFKNDVGMTPSEYRAEELGKSENTLQEE